MVPTVTTKFSIENRSQKKTSYSSKKIRTHIFLIFLHLNLYQDLTCGFLLKGN